MYKRQAGDLSEAIETGVRVDAAPSAELLLALFRAGSPLHDGAVVIQRGRVAAARCVLPLTTVPALRDVGTRHRAAVGLAEEIDAVVVVVSEERGEISLAVDGELHRRLDEVALRRLLTRLFAAPRTTGVARLLSRLGRSPTSPGEKPAPEDRRAAL